MEMANLTAKQIEKLKQTLLERQRVLTQEVSDQRAQTAEEGNEDAIGGPGDAGDESVMRMQTDLHLQEAGRDLEELRDIDAALTRIEDGSYGQCDECGSEISYARLEAQPTALRCVECQAQHEKTYAHKSTPTL
jgi:RNA polymerase-binding transcription factor